MSRRRRRPSTVNMKMSGETAVIANTDNPITSEELRIYATNAGLSALANTLFNEAEKNPNSKKTRETVSILDGLTNFAELNFEEVFANATPELVGMWKIATELILGLFGGWGGILDSLADGVEFKDTWSQYVYAQGDPAIQFLWRYGPGEQIDKLVHRDPKKPWTLPEFLQLTTPAGPLANLGLDVGSVGVKKVREAAEAVSSIVGSTLRKFLWFAGAGVAVGGAVLLFRFSRKEKARALATNPPNSEG